MVNSELIKGRIRELNIGQDYAARELGIAQSTLNLKINNKRHFTIAEMFKLSEILELTAEDLQSYFHAH